MGNPKKTYLTRYQAAAGPARKLGSPARFYRIHSGPARLHKTTRSSQGSTLRLRGTTRQPGSSTPHRVGLEHPRYFTAAPGSTVF